MIDIEAELSEAWLAQKDTNPLKDHDVESGSLWHGLDRDVLDLVLPTIEPPMRRKTIAFVLQHSERMPLADSREEKTQVRRALSEIAWQEMSKPRAVRFHEVQFSLMPGFEAQQRVLQQVGYDRA